MKWKSTLNLYLHYRKKSFHSSWFSHRMFTSYPGTKTYFSHLDISARSSHLLSHGKKIVEAIAEGAQDISQLAVNLGPLQTLHAYQLRIDPSNFKVPLLEHQSFILIIRLRIHSKSYYYYRLQYGAEFSVVWQWHHLFFIRSNWCQQLFTASAWLSCFSQQLMKLYT